MKKYKIISLFIILLILINPIVVSAKDTDYHWYIKKKGSSTPAFSTEAEFVKEEGGYYIDEYAAEHGEKIIYLTFDAGYDNGNVLKTLDILKKENVTGAFFILSNIINKNTDTVKRMFEEGHLVCNHTKNHKNMSTLTDKEMEGNLLYLESLCLEKTGYEMKKYFRFPEGTFSERTMKNANKLGYKTFFWSLAYADWDNNVKQTDESAINNILKNTHPGAIILLHPTSDINVRILPSLIKEWKKAGYTFGSLDDLVNRNI